MNASDLRYLFELNQIVLRTNAAGLTHEESLRTPPAGGNCLNWVLGHVIATRHAILKLLGRDGPWPAEIVDRYKRGSAPLTDASNARLWEQLLADFDHTQETLHGALEAATSEALSAPGGRVPTGDVDVAGRVAFLQFHEAYHIGQMGLLRRLAGKTGAIG